MLGKPHIRLNNLKTSLRFPCLGLNPIIDSINQSQIKMYRQPETKRQLSEKNQPISFSEEGTDGCFAGYEVGVWGSGCGSRYADISCHFAPEK